MKKERLQEKIGAALIRAAENGHEILICNLLALGASEEVISQAFFEACKRNEGEVVKLLLSCTNQDAREAAFTWAARCGYVETFSFFNFNNNNSLSEELLSIAARNGHISIVRLFLAEGVSVNPDCLRLAVFYNQPEVVGLLVAIGGANEFTALEWAEKYGRLEIMRILSN